MEKERISPRCLQVHLRLTFPVLLRAANTRKRQGTGHASRKFTTCFFLSFFLVFYFDGLLPYRGKVGSCTENGNGVTSVLVTVRACWLCNFHIWEADVNELRYFIFFQFTGKKRRADTNSCTNTKSTVLSLLVYGLPLFKNKFMLVWLSN